jgi:pSer/pThr/pTyr-binding forkhead associated (FHA) protein
MARQLVVIDGPDRGASWMLTEAAPLLIGRGRQAAARLSDLRVSRAHCQVRLSDAGIQLTDLDSAGGTFVNGRRVTECPLLAGDVIVVGKTQLRLQDENVADQTTLAPSRVVPPDKGLAPPPVQPAAAPRPRPAARTANRPLLLPAERMAELSGRTLSHYQLGPLLARGQSGLVFHASELKHGLPVALKVLWPQFTQSPKEVQRFIRSMRTMLPLRHPNLVTLHGAGKTGPYCWIAMEYIEGESLTQVIQRIGVAGMLDWAYALRVAIHLSRVLHFAHQRNIIHRNITPQNILIHSSDKRALLGDLMLAKALEGTLAQQITRPGEILGDVRYMSPERTKGSEGVDARSDIYSLGAMLYALLTGRPPLEGSSLMETLMKIHCQEPVRPKKFQMAIADMFEGTVMRMLAKRPEERFQTAGDLLAHLEAIAKFQGVVV